MVRKIINATQAAFFNSAKGDSDAASFTTDNIRAEPSSDASLQSVPTCFGLLPLPFAAILVVVVVSKGNRL